LNAHCSRPRHNGRRTTGWSGPARRRPLSLSVRRPTRAKRLLDLGYIERRNLLIEYRDTEGKPERFPALATELVALKVDVIVTVGGSAAAVAAKDATTTVPIVFTAVGDPVGEGLVSSLGRPGGNITGLSVVARELVGKSLELLKQAVPE
jgi:putative ABC transport system substrate-binding protein